VPTPVAPAMNAAASPVGNAGADVALPGATVWLTGLPSAGKTSVAQAVRAVLRERGRPAELLDGDEVRAALAGDLGFSRADRGAQVARVGWVARLLARHGVLALAPLVSPYRCDRDALRAASTAAGLAFLEVHVAAPVGVCARRDVKGLYAAQAAGRLHGLTGVDDPYEAPTDPELTLATHAETLDASVDRVLALLTARGLA